MEVSGELSLDERYAAAKFVGARLIARDRILVWTWQCVLLLAGGGGLGFTVFELAHIHFKRAPDSIIFIVLFIYCLGVIYYTNLVNRLLVGGWKAWGAPRYLPVTYRVEADALVCVWPATTTRVNWSGIGEISLDDRNWILFGEDTHYVLPRRFFGALEAEQSFLAACFDRLDPIAKSRSRGFVSLAPAIVPKAGLGRPLATSLTWSAITLAFLALIIFSPRSTPHWRPITAGRVHSWAALSVANNRWTGQAWGYPDELGAISSAQRTCEIQKDAVNCRPRGSIYEGCVALAVSLPENVLITAKSAGDAASQQAALAACRRAGGRSCYVQERVCSSDAG